MKTRNIYRIFRLLTGGLSAFSLSLIPGAAVAASALVVAFGASQTYGKGVSRGDAYPAQLEALLRAHGHNVHVINAGINGNTTGEMLGRLEKAVPNGTGVVILQPGDNDMRKGVVAARDDNIAAMKSRLAARGIAVIMLESTRGLPRGADGQHLTPEGYRMLAKQILPQVEGALGR
jgi:acyl-CoA thioesterase-1